MELLAAANRAAQIAPNKSPVELLECVLLEADAAQKKLNITATNLELTLKQSIPMEKTDDAAFSAVINAKLLVGMLSLLPGENVSLVSEGGSRVYVKNGTAAYGIRTQPAKDYPRMEIPFPEDTVKVSGIPSMVQRTVFASADDSTTPLLQCVHLKFTKDGLQAVGSDGTCLISALGDKDSTGDIAFLVPASSLRKLARLCTDKEVFSVGTTGQSLVFMREGLVFSARRMEGRYVDTDRLIAGVQNSFTVLSDAAELRQVLSSVLPLAAGDRVRLSFADGRLTLHCSGEQGDSDAALDIVPLTGIPSGNYWFCASKLSKCLRALDGAMTLGLAQGGMLTVSTENAKYLQTPMRPPAARKEKTKRVPKAA